ncbi:MAG TPA: hypothetical protein VMR45_04300 [Patescibacteria group bacterium]|nr:hypothetical protein [Patescibacteria group bacterium]
MSRLPKPGSDDDIWGELLNDYLKIEHNTDGSLKNVARPSDLDSKVDKSMLNAKGDIYVASARASLSRLGVGGEGQVLTVDSSQSTGLKWGTPTSTDLNAVRKGDLTVNARDYGAKGDVIRVINITASAGNAVVTSSNASFTAADTGKLAVVCTDTTAGAITTIQSVNSSTQITLAANAGLTISGSGAYLLYGSDDTSAIQAALNAAGTSHGVNTGIGPNSPMGLGFTNVSLPAGLSLQGGYMISSALTVPSGVRLDTQAFIFNFLSDRYAPCMIFSPYTRVGTLRIDAIQGTGIQIGSAANTQAHFQGDVITVWHCGTSTETSGQLRSQDCIVLLGYSFLIDTVWCKGGVRNIYHNAGSDCSINRAHCIGSLTGVHMNQSNQVFYGAILLDTVGKVGGGTNGVIIDNQCSNIDINVMAFMILGSTWKLDNVVAVGPISTNVNKLLSIKIQAALTGGNVLNLAYAQDLYYNVSASNNTAPSFGGSNITTAVVFGSSVTGNTSGEARLTGSITPYSGAVPGPLTYYRTGVRYFVQGGSPPSPLALAANGTSAPTPTTAGNDARGRISFGSGTAPTSGAQMQVTFASSNAYVATPYIVLTALNAATAALQPYIASSGTTNFTIGFAAAPAASQASGTYSLNYRIES